MTNKTLETLFKQKQDKYFELSVKPDTSKILVACSSVQHRKEITISALNNFPNKVIFGEPQEKELYNDYIEAGWKWVNQETPRYIGLIKNQILQYFKDSEYEYLLLVDDNIKWRNVTLNASCEFCTKPTNNVFNEWCAEFVRMQEENIDVITVPTTQYLTKNQEGSLLNKQRVDYCAFALSRKFFDYNYWFIDKTGEQSNMRISANGFFPRMLRANPNLTSVYSIFLRRNCPNSKKKKSEYEYRKVLLAKEKTVIYKIKEEGLTKEWKESLWSKEHFPAVFYPFSMHRKNKNVV